MRVFREKVVNLDELRATESGLFTCLWDKCRFSEMIEIPDRKNYMDDMCCRRCGRDFFEFETEKGFTTYYGAVWEDMKRVYEAHLNKKRLKSSGKKTKK